MDDAGRGAFVTTQVFRRGTSPDFVIALVAGGIGGGTEFAPPPRAESCVIISHRWETPVSQDLAPDFMDSPTGDVDVISDVPEVVRAGFQFIRDVATIPINEADDALIDKLVARATRNDVRRPLRRVP